MAPPAWVLSRAVDVPFFDSCRLLHWCDHIPGNVTPRAAKSRPNQPVIIGPRCYCCDGMSRTFGMCVAIPSHQQHQGCFAKEGLRSNYPKCQSSEHHGNAEEFSADSASSTSRIISIECWSSSMPIEVLVVGVILPPLLSISSCSDCCRCLLGFFKC